MSWSILIMVMFNMNTQEIVKETVTPMYAFSSKERCEAHALDITAMNLRSDAGVLVAVCQQSDHHQNLPREFNV